MNYIYWPPRGEGWLVRLRPLYLRVEELRQKEAISRDKLPLPRTYGQVPIGTTAVVLCKALDLGEHWQKVSIHAKDAQKDLINMEVAKLMVYSPPSSHLVVSIIL